MLCCVVLCCVVLCCVVLCCVVSILSVFTAIVKPPLHINTRIYRNIKPAFFQVFFRNFIQTICPAMSTFRGQKSLILSPFQSANFEGQGVCTLPLVFVFESVTGSFLQLYHYLVYKVCISALCKQLISVGKQSVEKIPSFFCC